jgi:[ribosomal protein S5]-alanine N-acetyltransferase
MYLQPHPSWSTAEVSLFVLEESHVNDRYVSWLNDPQINRYLESRFVTHSVESTRAFVRSVLDDPQSIMWGIRVAALGQAHVGNIKLGPIQHAHGLAEIGLMIGAREAWGKGVARRAIEMVSNYAFGELAMRKITAGCYADNVGSQRAFEATGFQVEATRPAHFLLDGQTQDLVLLARTRAVTLP